LTAGDGKEVGKRRNLVRGREYRYFLFKRGLDQERGEVEIGKCL